MKVNKMIRTASLFFAVVGILIINVIGFIVGNVHQDKASFITVIVCSNLLVVVEELLVLLGTKNDKTTLYRLLGAPLYFWAAITTLLQVVFLIIVVSVGRNTAVPFVATIIVEVLLLAFFVVQLVFGYLTRYFTLGLDKYIDEKTLTFEDFRRRIDLLIPQSDGEIKSQLEAVKDKMRYMVSISNKNTQIIDKEIDVTISNLEKDVQNEQASSYIESLNVLLEKRAVVSKS